MTSIVSPDRGRLLEWLEAQAGAVLTICDGRDEQALRAQPQPGRWSALQHLAHLGRMHEVYLARVRRMLSEDAPAIAAYRAEHDDEWNQWEGMTLVEIQQRIAGRRAELLELLRSLSNDEWRRIGRHSNFGSLTLAEWIEFFLVHEGHHLYTALTLARPAERGQTTLP
jgi:uncharacterized damage-inducible protein DinB